ncbi:MAG: efflux RND transporter periplasmic adaptor subunit, partial [Pseudomonadota bacterium]
LKSKPEIEPRKVDLPLPIVEVQQISLEPRFVTVVAYGNVETWRSLSLSAEVSGRVLWQSPSFEPGEVVEAGEPLLRIDATDYELALAEARQSLTSARLSLADAESLRQAKRVDEARAAVVSAEARIARAERDLANTEITAPYRAVIDQQLTEEGQFVTVGMQLGRILGADRAEVRLPIPPQDIGFVEKAVGAPVQLSTGEPGDLSQWQGSLARIEARVDTQTRVFPVVIVIEDPLDTVRHDAPLRFGQFVRAEITGGTVSDAVVIPQKALHGDDDVFLLEEGKLKRRHVDVGRMDNGGALITGGLQNGDLVVVTRLDLMFEGIEVELSGGA